MSAISMWFRRFFLAVQHYGHMMDATWAYERGDYAEYADCQRRANECQSELLRVRMERT